MDSIVRWDPAYIGDPVFPEDKPLGVDLLRQMMDNATLANSPHIGMDPGSAKGDMTAMATYSTGAEMQMKSVLTIEKIRAVIAELEKYALKLPPNPYWIAFNPNKVHKKRRNQTEAYHRRIQKKWAKRFGSRYGEFVVKPINPWDMYLTDPPERKASTGMELMMQSMLSVPRYPAMLPSDSVMMINSIA